MPNSRDIDHKDNEHMGETNNTSLLVLSRYDGVQIYTSRAPLMRSLTCAQDQMHRHTRISHGFNLDLYRNCNFGNFTYDAMFCTRRIFEKVEKIMRGIADEEKKR
jgi:hypothetical protein